MLQALEQHALVGDMLIEEENLLVGGRNDERVLHLAEDAPEERSRLERGRHAEERRLLGDAAGRRLIETTVAAAYAHVGNHRPDGGDRPSVAAATIS